MYRSIAVVAALAAAVSVASADYIKLSTTEDCSKTVAELEAMARSSVGPAKEMAEGRAAIAQLRVACESGDLVVAGLRATEARQSLASEN